MSDTAVPTFSLDRIGLLIAMALGAVALILSLVAVTRPLPDAIASAANLVTEGCDWVAGLSPDWIPGIGAEPSC